MVYVVAMVMTACVIKLNLKTRFLEWMSKQLSPNSQTHQNSFVESSHYTVTDVELTESAYEEYCDFDEKDHHHHEMKAV